MALLTADDVLNKKFQPTKFREGYDQDEVDDFLDEVVNTIRAITGENEELRARLSGGGSESAAPEPTDAAHVGATVPAGETASAAEGSAVVEGQAGGEGQAAEGQAAGEGQAAAVPAEAGPQEAAGMLALAQKVHDEYVRSGQAEGERILAEARAAAERAVQEAQEQKSHTLGTLEEERTLLERKIDELRVFERDYRSRLKSYLEGLLADVQGRADANAQAEN